MATRYTLTTTAQTQTLTNKTIDADSNTISNLETDNIKAGTLVTEAEGIENNDNDTTIATNAAIIDYVSNYILDAIYPVGAIYISVASTSPATLFGGTWSAFGAGKTLVGIDSGDAAFDTVEETGGAKTHTLTIAEMPAHSHGISTCADNTATGSGRYKPGTNDNLQSTSKGGGEAHNNLPPYIVIYMWKRTA